MKLKVFVGPIGSGKDTCAKILNEIGGLGPKIPFAGPLKDICSRVWGIPLESFEDPLKKEELFLDDYRYSMNEQWDTAFYLVQEMTRYDPRLWKGLGDHLSRLFQGTRFESPRHLLQFVGTQIIRQNVASDWHCRAAFSDHHIQGVLNNSSFCKNTDIFPVTDCRFINEYEYLQQNYDVEFFYIHRPEAEKRLQFATHVSELEIFELRDRIREENIIMNYGNLDDLQNELSKVFPGINRL